MKNRHKQALNYKKRKMMSDQMRHRLQEGGFLLCAAVAILLLISLITYHPDDPGWSSTGLGRPIGNWGGRVGAWFADLSLSLFGVVAYALPVLMIFSTWLNLKENANEAKVSHDWFFKILGWCCIMAGACALTGFHFSAAVARLNLPAQAGGILGDIVNASLIRWLNATGSGIFFMAALLGGMTLVTGISWLSLADRLGEKTSQFGLYLYSGIREWISNRNRIEVASEFSPAVLSRPVSPPAFPSIAHSASVKILSQPIEVENKPRVLAAPVISSASVKVEEKVEKPLRVNRDEASARIQLTAGALPTVDLLISPPVSTKPSFSDISFESLSQLVEQRLYDFGVEVNVVAVHPGPIITRFELSLAPGIKVSKITGLAKDIARSLSVTSVRIVEVIPGKSVIGLEIPNEHREMVFLREMLESDRYTQSDSPASLVLGKDTSGHPVIADLTKMPHLLVAGTTGSGKSVSLNVMLLSLLFKATPEQLRLIMIDPKMLELSVYDGIPHLLTPVIVDMKDAANALRWCVGEMDKRYQLMASLGVRNLAGYNQKVSEALEKGQGLSMPSALVTDEASAKLILEPLPIIVVIIDEFADMMMVVGKKVEELIARIAQKARAAGIHLILATQRPSVDVITGLIKANIPTRIAFQVSSRIDSRTILDQQGAEQLLGHGDMLYLPPGVGVPMRVHGAYVSDEEVHRVVAAWRSAGQPVYLHEVTDEAMEGGGSESHNAEEQDGLYDEAVQIVLESQRASISLVQRRLRIGYNRAARMMEAMQAAGIVSAMDQNGAREVIVPSRIDD